MARATILVAEDDERVRTLLATMLDEFGYDVLTAVDGEDALRVAAAHAGDIDVVLTDLVMPNMLARTLEQVLAGSSGGAMMQ